MEREIICISCPIGCHLTVKFHDSESPSRENIIVQNNKCSRGEIYGKEEVLSPKRVVTATCSIDSVLMERIPVKTTGPLAKEHIDGLLEDLYRLKLSAPITIGEILIKDIKGSGIDIITTRSLLK